MDVQQSEICCRLVECPAHDYAGFPQVATMHRQVKRLERYPPSSFRYSRPARRGWTLANTMALGLLARQGKYGSPCTRPQKQPYSKSRNSCPVTAGYFQENSNGDDLVSTGVRTSQMQAERCSPSPKSRLQTTKRQEQRLSVLAPCRTSGHRRWSPRRCGLTHTGVNPRHAGGLPIAAPKPVESVLYRLLDAGSIPAVSTISWLGSCGRAPVRVMAGLAVSTHGNQALNSRAQFQV